MNTELVYLLEELNNNWANNDVITVQNLKQMINNSFIKAAQHQNQLYESMSEIGHDM